MHSEKSITQRNGEMKRLPWLIVGSWLVLAVVWVMIVTLTKSLVLLAITPILLGFGGYAGLRLLVRAKRQ
ncbi:MAG: hypothetical protein PHC70_02060 [Patescibacteria group bacterium]|nr:hypothetical protein [Patescibacteria group bacterium]